MNPTLTLHKEKKPGFLTLCEAFDYACNLFDEHIAELVAQLRAKGFNVLTAEAHAAAVGKKGGIPRAAIRAVF